MSWEDPRVDQPVLDIKEGDQLLTLTSGACNIFDLALQGATVWGVDLNPAQSHLLELKRAALAEGLSHEVFWELFGAGVCPNISIVFESLRPHLSEEAEAFWEVRLYYFRGRGHGGGHGGGLYHHGGMGHMINGFKWFFWATRLSKVIKELYEAPDIAAQVVVWEKLCADHVLLGFMIKVACTNSLILWFGAGVPSAQVKLIQNDGLTTFDYTLRAIDGVVRNSLLREDNYFWLGVLRGSFTPESCPRYLKKDVFGDLKRIVAAGDRINVRTCTFLEELRAREYDKVILMDHLDWVEDQDAKEMAVALHRQVRVGGRIIWRSAGREPPYNKHLEAVGFEVRCVGQKDAEGRGYIDMVNTYASFWVGVRVE